MNNQDNTCDVERLVVYHMRLDSSHQSRKKVRYSDDVTVQINVENLLRIANYFDLLFASQVHWPKQIIIL